MENEQGQVNTVANAGTSTTSPMQSTALNFLLGDEAVSSIQGDTANILNRAQESFDTMSRGAEATRDFTRGRAEDNAALAADTLVSNARVQRMGMLESSGMGISMAQFQVFDDTVNKQMNQIETMRQDALRAADMDYYNQLSQAQMNLVNTQIQSTNSMYEKLFGIAGISQSQQQIQLSQEAQAFEQSSTMGSIALEYGLDMRPGESMESLITRAMPFASERQKLQLEGMRADIAAKNAQTASLRADMARADRKEQFMKALTVENVRDAMLSDYRFADEAAGIAVAEGNVGVLKTIREGKALYARDNIRNITNQLATEGVTKAQMKDTVLALYPSIGMDSTLKDTLDMVLAEGNKKTNKTSFDRFNNLSAPQDTTPEQQRLRQTLLGR